MFAEYIRSQLCIEVFHNKRKHTLCIHIFDPSWNHYITWRKRMCLLQPNDPCCANRASYCEWNPGYFQLINLKADTFRFIKHLSKFWMIVLCYVWVLLSFELLLILFVKNNLVFRLRNNFWKLDTLNTFLAKTVHLKKIKIDKIGNMFRW